MKSNKEMLIKKIQESKNDHLIEEMILTMKKTERFDNLENLVNTLLETCDCTLGAGVNKNSWTAKINRVCSITSEGLYIENDKGYDLILDPRSLRLVAKISKALEEIERGED